MKIFLAGAEQKKWLNEVLLKSWCKNFLLSYFYLWWRPEKQTLEILESVRKQAELMFLDSGAHTFLAANDLKVSSVKWNKSKLPDPHTYMENYKNWLVKYWHYFDIVAELDIWEVPSVWYDTVKKWRKDLDFLGDKLLVVSHHNFFRKIFPKRTDEYERLLNEYKYVAIWDEPDQTVLNNYFYIWKKVWKNTRIHWFAETKVEKVWGYPYFSVDSTTWNIWSLYWTFLIFDEKEKKMKSFVTKWLRTSSKEFQKMKDYLSKNLEYVCPSVKSTWMENMLKYEGWLLRDRQNVFAMIRMQEYATYIWNCRGVKF